MQTRTLTLVIQRVGKAHAFNGAVAAALDEYSRDLAAGNAGNGTFERHINNGCRIEAISSIPPVQGSEAREDVVAADGIGALRERVHNARALADFLPGGDSAGEIGAALGYNPLEAAKAMRVLLDETLAALGEDES